MKIRLSELRQIVQEEIKNITEDQQQDQSSYDQIMSLINSEIGNTPESQKIANDILTAIQKKKVPNTLSMKSLAQDSNTPQTSPTQQTLSMKSIR